MRLEWIDDILAVLDSGSLSGAAERRFLTQSAFTRRVRMIEERIGAPLFDRRRKPVTLMPGVAALEPELRDLSTRLRRLSNALGRAAEQTRAPLRLACQHALTTTVSPRIIAELAVAEEAQVRVRSGNRDDCLLHLLSGGADFALMYEVPGERVPMLPAAFEAVTLGTDSLIPVSTPAAGVPATAGEISVVSYPPDVFLGQLFERTIAPRLPVGLTLIPRAESALTLAVLQFVLSDVGLAWLPQSLVAKHLAAGRLTRWDDLPSQELEIRMIRLPDAQDDRRLAVWRHLQERLPASL